MRVALVGPSLFVLCSFVAVLGLPVQYTIPQGGEECLYEKIDGSETFTVSAIVLGGARLTAEAVVEGPVAPASAESSVSILEGIAKYESGDNFELVPMKSPFAMDFGHYDVAASEEAGGGGGGEPEQPVAEERDAVPPKEGETPEEQRARRAQERRKALEARHRGEKLKQTQKKKIREEGKPIERTYKVVSPGWYRFCVRSPAATITVELDLRKETDYGGINEDGHVFTMEEMEVEEDEKLMAKDTAAEEGIKDEDFQAAREKLKTLRRLLADIQSKQTQERHRLNLHSATNEHSHSRMVLSSLLETVLFMLVTGFQVFTIRRWFKGAPQLGR